jgi:hypothetical protein
LADFFVGVFGIESPRSEATTSSIGRATSKRREVITLSDLGKRDPSTRKAIVSTPVRTALLFTFVLIAGEAPAAAGERMKGDDITSTFQGMTLDGIYDDGSFFSETYFEDGTIRYRDTDGADSGEWSVTNDTFCTFYEGQTGACFFVDRDGLNCFTFYEAVEDAAGKFAPKATWTSRGWNREAESTCPTPPGAEI